jgi:cytochrome c oxidase cbb3-type subunit 1
MVYIVALGFGGVLQGLAMNNPDVPFLDPAKHSVVTLTLPYLKIRSHSGILIALGHLAFAVSFVWILIRWRKAVRQPQAAATLTNP